MHNQKLVCTMAYRKSKLEPPVTTTMFFDMPVCEGVHHGSSYVNTMTWMLVPTPELPYTERFWREHMEGHLVVLTTHTRGEAVVTAVGILGGWNGLRENRMVPRDGGRESSIPSHTVGMDMYKVLVPVRWVTPVLERTTVADVFGAALPVPLYRDFNAPIAKVAHDLSSREAVPVALVAWLAEVGRDHSRVYTVGQGTITRPMEDARTAAVAHVLWHAGHTVEDAPMPPIPACKGPKTNNAKAKMQLMFPAICKVIEPHRRTY